MNTRTARIMARMYGDHLWPVLEPLGVHRFDDVPAWLAREPHLAVVGATSGVLRIRPRVDLVVASTCIDHCDASPNGLAATVLADLLHGIEVARLLGVPLLSFVGVREEVDLVPGGGELAHGWARVAGTVDDLFAHLAPEGARLVRTDRPDVTDVVASTVERDRPHLPDEALDGLYHLLDHSLFPRGTPFTYFYEYYRANLARYRRPVIERLMGPCPGGVLVVENVQQSKAVHLARELNAPWPTEHLVTLPAPGRGGGERATRSRGTDALRLRDLLDRDGEALAGADEDSRAFWCALLGRLDQPARAGGGRR